VITSSNCHFGFTKLLVNNLETSAEFYTSVCGLVEKYRLTSDIAGRELDEIVFERTQEGASAFILMSFKDTSRPVNEELITGFNTDNLDAFIERALNAGGSILAPTKDHLDHGVKVAILKDNEGHMIEVVQSF
jgi:lactoylglutathione lyase